MQKTWIFQLSRPLPVDQQAKVEQEIGEFLKVWKAHGHPVTGSGKVLHSRFILLQAEEGSTSGCSIDNMTREIDRILAFRGVSQLESSNIYYRNPGGDFQYIDFREVKAAINHGLLTADTLIYDCSMGQSSDISRFELPLRSTWLARFLPQAV